MCVLDVMGGEGTRTAGMGCCSWTAQSLGGEGWWCLTYGQRPKQEKSSRVQPPRGAHHDGVVHSCGTSSPIKGAGIASVCVARIEGM